MYITCLIVYFFNFYTRDYKNHSLLDYKNKNKNHSLLKQYHKMGALILIEPLFVATPPLCH